MRKEIKSFFLVTLMFLFVGIIDIQSISANTLEKVYHIVNSSFSYDNTVTRNVYLARRGNLVIKNNDIYDSYGSIPKVPLRQASLPG